MNYTKPEMTTVEKAKALLIATDYSQLPDVYLTEASKAEFTAYRAVLRSLIIMSTQAGQEPAENNIPAVQPVAVWDDSQI
tara:strand:+ start:2269 stop:2508 length:240 start_codon:yes stop_codon:yes gene_type:complete